MATVLTADLIRAARGLLGWSQRELAEKSGVTQKALSDCELGKKPLTMKTSTKIRKTLEENNLQFFAANIEGSEIVGAGVRWRPDANSFKIKVI